MSTIKFSLRSVLDVNDTEKLDYDALREHIQQYILDYKYKSAKIDCDKLKVDITITD